MPLAYTPYIRHLAPPPLGLGANSIPTGRKTEVRSTQLFIEILALRTPCKTPTNRVIFPSFSKGRFGTAVRVTRCSALSVLILIRLFQQSEIGMAPPLLHFCLRRGGADARTSEAVQSP